MKRFTSLLIGCSLALAGAAMAQQPDEQSSPAKKKKNAAEETTQAQPGATATQTQEKTPKHNRVKGERGVTSGQGTANEPGTGKGRKGKMSQESTNAAQSTDVSGQATASATPGMEKHGKGMKGRAAKTSPATSPAAATGAMSATPAPSAAAAASATPAISAAPSATVAGQQSTQTNVAGGGKGKKVEPQQVQQIKAQHANFRAQPKPQQVPAVTFNQNYRIQGSDRWTGPQYEVFRSYRPERHDQGWYRSHYNRVELIGGGYYFWNNGYWYPAWGYSPQAEYYAYDGPIYVGHRAEPPDRVIADVQAELQQMGYYRGEVDGLLGPLTREALTAYQADQGLIATAVIDEPTLDSLGLS